MIKKTFIFFTLLLITQKIATGSILQDGIVEFNKKNYIRAENILEYALQQDPHCPTTRYYYAMTLVYNKKYKYAAQEYQYIIKHFPNTYVAQKSKTGLKNIAVDAGISVDKIKINHRGNIIILPEVTVNNRLKLSMLLDTGASYMVITQKQANSLGLRNFKNVKLSTANGIVTGKLTTLKSVKVGNSESKNVAAVILPDATSGRVQGILGLSFLKNYKYTIDRKNSLLILDKN